MYDMLLQNGVFSILLIIFLIWERDLNKGAWSSHPFVSLKIFGKNHLLISCQEWRTVEVLNNSLLFQMQLPEICFYVKRWPTQVLQYPSEVYPLW